MLSNFFIIVSSCARGSFRGLFPFGVGCRTCRATPSLIGVETGGPALRGMLIFSEACASKRGCHSLNNPKPFYASQSWSWRDTLYLFAKIRKIFETTKFFGRKVMICLPKSRK